MNHSNNRVRGVKNQPDPEYVRSAAAAAFTLPPTIDRELVISDDYIIAYYRSKMHQGGWYDDEDQLLWIQSSEATYFISVTCVFVFEDMEEIAIYDKK
jgi:hypothetical protein